MGAGSGTALHRNNIVDVILDPTFNAKSGAAAYNPASFTCSNISCHGGSRTQSVTQAGQNPRQSTVTLTPSWLTGTIDVSTDCTACHVLGSKVGTVVTPENNSYYSGRHYLHVWDPNNPPQPKLSCTACHDTTSLGTNHFTTLNTPAMEGPASATIWSFVNYDGVSCTPACHGNKTW
jgi:predicted CxxxxCH...CXXCH cytochrome family protein